MVIALNVKYKQTRSKTMCYSQYLLSSDLSQLSDICFFKTSIKNCRNSKLTSLKNVYLIIILKMEQFILIFKFFQNKIKNTKEKIKKN